MIKDILIFLLGMLFFVACITCFVFAWYGSVLWAIPAFIFLALEWIIVLCMEG